MTSRVPSRKPKAWTEPTRDRSFSTRPNGLVISSIVSGSVVLKEKLRSRFSEAVDESRSAREGVADPASVGSRSSRAMGWFEKPSDVKRRPTTPELESVGVEIDPTSKSSDFFFSRLKFNLTNDDSFKTIRFISIYRAEVDEPKFTRTPHPLSSYGVYILSTVSTGRWRPNTFFETLSNLDESGVLSSFAQLHPVDPVTGQRQSATTEEPSVPDEHRYAVSGSVPEGTDVRAESAGSTGDPLNVSGLTTVEGNQIGFEKIAVFSYDPSKATLVGDKIEMTYVDQNILYGRGYKYFVVVMDREMRQSKRSRVVDVVVEGLRVPARPSEAVATAGPNDVAFCIKTGDALVEKFEVYRKGGDSTVKSVTIVSDPSGFPVSKIAPEKLQNEFTYVGDCVNRIGSGGVFADVDVVPGTNYVYRFYSVDIFGNKSESPYQVSVGIRGIAGNNANLRKVSAYSEVDAGTNGIKLTFSCDDPLVKNIYVERRDFTSGRKMFSTPSRPGNLTLGPGRIKRSSVLEGTPSNQTDFVDPWNGIFRNAGVDITFVDRTVAIDQIYQYRFHGVDLYGNKTMYTLTQPLLVTNYPMVNSPIELTARNSTDEAGTIQNVVVKWTEANQDVVAEELTGSQDALADRSVRTLYQVERKREGEEEWLQFPLMSGTILEDRVVTASVEQPSFRPPYVEMNTTYFYRVLSLQSGTILSNFSPSVEHFVGGPVTTPANMNLRTPDVTSNPFYVMVNWDTPENSGIVDKWEIERVGMNNFAAAKLNIRDRNVISTLPFVPHRTVYRESSRSTSNVVDADETVNAKIITGQHRLQDLEVVMGNTYVYRIRAIGVEGDVSSWAYRGIKLTSSSFEKKWMPTFSQPERNDLGAIFAPMTYGNGSMRKPKDGFSLNPFFSTPDHERTK